MIKKEKPKKFNRLKYLICKIKGHNPIYTDDNPHILRNKHCKRCGINLGRPILLCKPGNIDFTNKTNKYLQ